MDEPRKRALDVLPVSAFRDEISVMLDLAWQAREVAFRYYTPDMHVDYKGIDDPVTQADREINELIVSGLRRFFPDDGILSEEAPDSPETRLGKRRLWCVDPLDGTREYTERLPQWAVMIGLAVDGSALAGVVYSPPRDLTLIGIVGEGAWMWDDGWRPLHVSQVRDPRRATMAVSRSHRSPHVDALARELGITREIPHGSVGMKIALLALQEADLYVHPTKGTKEWDLCAPEAVLVGAGGRMTDMYGRPFRYNKPNPANPYGLIASNGFLHDAAVEAVRKIIGATGTS